MKQGSIRALYYDSYLKSYEYDLYWILRKIIQMNPIYKWMLELGVNLTIRYLFHSILRFKWDITKRLILVIFRCLRDCPPESSFKVYISTNQGMWARVASTDISQLSIDHSSTNQISKYNPSNLLNLLKNQQSRLLRHWANTNNSIEWHRYQEKYLKSWNHIIVPSNSIKLFAKVVNFCTNW